MEFEFPGNSASRNASTENSSALRKKISRNDIPLTTRGNSDENANNPEALFNELQTLRKKYDAVVEYTVHLTAERDAIVSQLESSQRELTKEKSKKRSDGPGSNSKGDRADKKSSEKVRVAVYLFQLLHR